MSLSALRAAVVADLAAAVPELRTCAAHGGRFGLPDLKRVAARAPAVLVACLGVVDAVAGHGDTVVMARWAAFVLVTDRPGAARDEGALLLVAEVLRRLAGNRFGDAAENIPRELRAENLYSGPLDQQGVALWGVTWRQPVSLAADTGALADFLRFYADYDLAAPDGQIDATDHVTLPAAEESP